MTTAKEFYLDLSNSENNILDLSEYKGKKIRIFIDIEDNTVKLPIGYFNPVQIESYTQIENRENLYER